MCAVCGEGPAWQGARDAPAELSDTYKSWLDWITFWFHSRDNYYVNALILVMSTSEFASSLFQPFSMQVKPKWHVKYIQPDFMNPRLYNGLELVFISSDFK